MRAGAVSISLLIGGLVFSLSGCVSLQVIPPKERLSQIRSIEVVAIEPPPLTVTGDYFQSGGLSLLSGASGPGGGGLGLLYGIVILVKLPEELHTAKTRSESYQEILAKGEAWIPTEILAKRATDRLNGQGGCETRLRPGVRMLPGIVDRRTTALMENWYAPLRAWYNADAREAAPGEEGAKPDAFLEIGIINYELMWTDLLLQVTTKLVDGKTGKVIGRTRNYDYVNVGDPKRVFADNAAVFKDKFSGMGFVLIEKCLKEMHLVR
ncbi:MAG TPA: hypothetical protein VGK27_02520 [Candidatus Deferrimicrobiaceae bacterium]|jgi:hypothetical protein